MSYGVGAALQAAVYQRLAGDGALDALVSGAIHDSIPPGTVLDIQLDALWRMSGYTAIDGNIE